MLFYVLEKEKMERPFNVLLYDACCFIEQLLHILYYMK